MTIRTASGNRDRNQKVKKLAQAIVATAREHRRGFSVRDAQAAGFSEADVNRLFDDAMAEARRIEPAIDGMTVQS